MRGMEACDTSSTLKMFCCREISEKLEVVSNLRPGKIWVKVDQKALNPGFSVEPYLPR